MPRQKTIRRSKSVSARFTPPLHRDGTTASMSLATLACHLDRQADAELFHGHHSAAERLSRRAAELREHAA